MLTIMNNINKVFFDDVDSRILIFFDNRESAEATIDFINDNICFDEEGAISLRRILDFAEVFDTSSIFNDFLDGVYRDRTLVNLEEVSGTRSKEKEYGYYIYRNTVHSWALSLPLPRTSLDEYLENMEKHCLNRQKFDKDNCPKPSNPIDISPKKKRAHWKLSTEEDNLNTECIVCSNCGGRLPLQEYCGEFTDWYSSFCPTCGYEMNDKE